jgi:hypothetical protein
VRRAQVDLHKFSSAIIGLAAAEAERQAQAEHDAASHSAQQAGSTAISETPARSAGAADD